MGRNSVERAVVGDNSGSQPWKEILPASSLLPFKDALLESSVASCNRLFMTPVFALITTVEATDQSGVQGWRPMAEWRSIRCTSVVFWDMSIFSNKNGGLWPEFSEHEFFFF